MMQLTANERYKQSGSTLSFKNFIIREKAKMASIEDGNTTDIIVNKPLNNAVQDSLKAIKNDLGYSDTLTNKTLFGIDKKVLILSALAITGIIIYITYKNKKS